jgi:saposin
MIFSVYCEACEFSIKFIKYELKWDKSDERVKVTLENVCKIVPENIKEECVSIIETYGIYLINMIDLYMDNKLVCRKLNLFPI